VLLVLRQGNAMKDAFIDANRKKFAMKVMTRVLSVTGVLERYGLIGSSGLRMLW
jgi:hypothetical protein